MIGLIALSVHLLLFSLPHTYTFLYTILALFNNPSSYNLDLIHRPVLRPRLHKPHPLHNPQPTLHPPKNRVLPIQPRRGRQSDKELTSIRILPTIRHTQNPRPRVLQPWIYLVLKLFAVDRGTTATCASGIAGLQHEVWNYTVKDDVVVVAALGECGEVVAGLDRDVSV